jgi:hypothetical protein
MGRRSMQRTDGRQCQRIRIAKRHRQSLHVGVLTDQRRQNIVRDVEVIRSTGRVPSPQRQFDVEQLIPTGTTRT